MVDGLNKVSGNHEKISFSFCPSSSVAGANSSHPRRGAVPRQIRYLLTMFFFAYAAFGMIYD